MTVGRVAVEKNLEAFLALDLPGTKVVIGDGPQMAELQRRYPKAKFLGEKTVTRVIFGPTGVEPLLGVLALESVGMFVDPLSRKIKRIHARPAYQRALERGGKYELLGGD